MLCGLLLSLLAAAPAAAVETGTPPEAAADPAPDEQLRAAIGLYLDGRPAEARAALEAVLARGPSLPAPVRWDALAYLGDILYSEQGESAARGVFEALLADAPAYQMDPFNHPPEVVRHFEDLRRQLVKDLPLPPEPRRPRDPYPWLVTLPAGAYYFKERQVLPGLTVAALQIAGAGVSIWARGEMLAIPNFRADPDGGLPAAEDPDGEYRARYQRLYATNLTAGIVGWAAYVVPITVETVRWGVRGQATVAVGPTEVRVVLTF